MSTHRRIDINAEVKSAIEELLSGLHHSSLFALIADSLGKLPPSLKLPESNIIGIFHVGSGSVEAEPKPETELWSEMRETFVQYCIRYAIVAMITSSELYLQRLYFLAELAKVVTHCGGTIKGEMFHEIKSRCAKKFRHSSVDGLVEETFNSIGLTTPNLSLLESFRSIYGLRKCLVHRGGIIGREDVDDRGGLTALWQKPVLSVNGKDVASLPLRVDKGQTVDVRFVYERREWHPGDELQLTTENCQHIAITLGQFGKELGGELINGIHTMLTSKPH